MRAAVLMSVFFTICGVAALFGVPAVHVGRKPVLGILGFATALAIAVVPPLAVLAWRKIAGQKDGGGTSAAVPPKTSRERTRER